MYVLRCPGCGQRVWIQHHREGGASFFCSTCRAHVPRWPGEPIVPAPRNVLRDEAVGTVPKPVTPGAGRPHP